MDGTTPSTSSTRYTTAIAVNATTIVQAIAVASGYSQSGVAVGSFTITPPAASPTFSPASGTYTTPQSVTLSDATSGATIYYTLDGSTPSSSSAVYVGAISVTATTTIKAIGMASGYSQSGVATGTFTITPPAATPTFSPAPGTFTTTQSVTLSDATTGASIYYTTDGSTPTASSLHYTSAIAVSTTTTIKAMATASGYSQSSVASGGFTITPPAATPTFSPAPGTFTAPQSVNLSGCDYRSNDLLHGGR